MKSTARPPGWSEVPPRPATPYIVGSPNWQPRNSAAARTFDLTAPRPDVSMPQSGEPVAPPPPPPEYSSFSGAASRSAAFAACSAATRSASACAATCCSTIWTAFTSDAPSVDVGLGVPGHRLDGGGHQRAIGACSTTASSAGAGTPRSALNAAARYGDASAGGVRVVRRLDDHGDARADQRERSAGDGEGGDAPPQRGRAGPVRPAQPVRRRGGPERRRGLVRAPAPRGAMPSHVPAFRIDGPAGRPASGEPAGGESRVLFVTVPSSIRKRT